MEKKIALIFGVTGQDGSYLARMLLGKGYVVHGVRRRASHFSTDRIDDIYTDPHESEDFFLHYADLTDSLSIINIIARSQPDEIYNLAAQSNVAVSFENPEYTAQVDGLGALRILEAIRILGLVNKSKYYQASTSELYGKVKESPQTELTPFYPRSPYAVSKLFAHWITINYREAYQIFAVNGILFNHESPLRGETFVTRKITRGLARIKLGLQGKLYLGNLNSLRDWGHAVEYVEMQWMMLQQPVPRDYVIATGRQATVREFITLVAHALELELQWHGEGASECALWEGREVIQVDPAYYRPTEVETLLGNPRLAETHLGWVPRISLEELADEMVKSDLELAMREISCGKNGLIRFGRL